MPTNAGVVTTVDVNQALADRAVRQTDKVWNLVFNNWRDSKAGIGAIWNHRVTDEEGNVAEDRAKIADILRKLGDRAEAAFEDSNKTIAFLMQGTATQQGKVLQELAKYGLWDLETNQPTGRVSFNNGRVTYLDTIDINEL